MEQAAPKHINVQHKEIVILAALGFQKNDLLPNAPLQVVNTGNSFLLIPVKNEDILKNITPDFEAISKTNMVRHNLNIISICTNGTLLVLKIHEDLVVNLIYFPRYNSLFCASGL